MDHIFIKPQHGLHTSTWSWSTNHCEILCDALTSVVAECEIEGCSRISQECPGPEPTDSKPWVCFHHAYTDLALKHTMELSLQGSQVFISKFQYLVKEAYYLKGSHHYLTLSMCIREHLLYSVPNCQCKVLKQDIRL